VFCGLFLIALSWVFSLDRAASAPSIVGIFELLIVYFLTINVVRSREDIQQILDGWVLAITFGSVLVVVSYLQRTILIIGAEDTAKQNVDSVAGGERSLFRASYFVAGFYHPQACAIASIVTRLLFPPNRRVSYKVVMLLALFINISCMVLMGSTTIIGVVAFATILALLWSFRGEGGAVRFARAMFVAAVGSIAVAILLPVLMPRAQILLLVARLGQHESLLLRLPVWLNVIHYLLETPRALLFGIGPDASVRLLDKTSFVWRLFLGGGTQQGAVDNGYLFILLNYGVLAFLLLMSMVGRLAFRLTRMLMHRVDPLALEPWLWIVTWAAISLTQQHGVDKTALLFVQGFALAALLPIGATPRILIQPDTP
jgi:O-antigen ligase